MTNVISRRSFLLGVGAAAGVVFADGFAERPLVRFGVFTDAHYKEGSASNGLAFGGVQGRVRTCVNVMNARRPDFMIELGDFKDTNERGAAGRNAALGFLETIEAEYARFDGPRYHAIGNHDTDSLTKDEVLGVFLSAATAGRAHYAFDVNGVRLIVLDTNYMGEAESDSYSVLNWANAMTTPYLSALQLDWLDAQLASAAGPCIVFSHHRLDSAGGVNKIVNHEKVGRIFRRRGNVKAVFCGHDHAGATLLENGVYHHCCRSLGQDASDNPNRFFEVSYYPSGAISVLGFTTA